MNELLLSPATPFVALSVVGALLAALGLVWAERERHALAGFRALPSRLGMSGRYIVGQVAAVPLAGLLVLIVLATGMEGMQRTLLLACAAGMYLCLGVVIPRRPIVRQQQEDRRIRSLLPGFVNYVRVSLEGYDAPITLLERYVARPNSRLAVMQDVVRSALDLHASRRLRPFEALALVARARACVELRDVAEQLVQSERDGTTPVAALEAFGRTLETILRDEFQRMLKRRMMYLMATVAISLVVGILGNLLFVMTRGGQLLGG